MQEMRQLIFSLICYDRGHIQTLIVEHFEHEHNSP